MDRPQEGLVSSYDERSLAASVARGVLVSASWGRLWPHHGPWIVAGRQLWWRWLELLPSVKAISSNPPFAGAEMGIAVDTVQLRTGRTRARVTRDMHGHSMWKTQVNAAEQIEGLIAPLAVGTLQ